ncbi:MAG: hypothetical protein ABSA76_01275 [Bacteroidales bacterium]
MKKSEELRIEAGSVESDSKAYGILTKAMREKREERFIEKYLPKLKEMVKSTIYVDPVKRSYLFDTEKYGRIIFYPKANNLLICKRNKWIKPGLQWLIQNFKLK